MTIRNKLWNEYIRGSIGVAPIVNKMWEENKSRWLEEECDTEEYQDGWCAGIEWSKRWV